MDLYQVTENVTDVVMKVKFSPDDPSFVITGSIMIGVLIVGYLWYIMSYGPRWMKDKQPYNIINLCRWYNVFQFVACLTFVVRSYQMGFTFQYLWKCESFDFLSKEVKEELVLGSWLFLGLRMIEFIETVFFILRKKRNQASFLHVYHHISTVILMWVFLVYDTELMAIYNASINSFIHVVMYAYYFLSSYKSIRDHLNYIKPVITIMQMVQFFAILAQCTIAILPDCSANGIFFHLQIVNLCILVMLFGHFFVTNYLKKKPSI